MAIEVAVSANYDYSDSVFVNAPCRCHLVIVDVDEDGFRLGGKNPSGDMVVECEVVAASDIAQLGLRQRLYFQKTAESAWVMANFAISAGVTDPEGKVITAEYVKQCRENGKLPVIDFEGSAVGKQFFGEITLDNYNPAKPKLKIQARDFHHLTSKQCISKERWPREENFIKRSGVVMPTAAAAKPGAATAAATSPQGAPQTKAGAAAAGALSGLSSLKL